MPSTQQLHLSFDEILPYIGEYGRFQNIVQFMFCLAGIPLAFPVLIMYFAALQPKWQCAPGASEECPYNGTFTSSDNRRCDMAREAWEYTQPDDYSIVTHFDIYCSQEWMIHLTTSIVFIGWIPGAIFLGWLGDRYGRKIVLFQSIAVVLIVGFLSAFSPNIGVFIVSRFIVGFFIPGSGPQLFVLMSEIVGQKYRAKAGISLFLFYTLGNCIMALKAYLVPHWKTLYIICHAPYIFVLLFWWHIPESVRWMHARGDVDKAMSTCRNIAKFNKMKIPDQVTLAPLTNGEVEKSTLMDLFRTRKRAIMTWIQGNLKIILHSLLGFK